MRKISRLAAFVIISLVVVLFALPLQSDSVDDFVKASMQQQKIPGLALAVMREGRIIKAQGYGLANVELNVPVTPETIFQSGSVGKQFTATAVMMLVVEGKVGLEDKITQYFHDAPETWNAITVRHLLTHTSGIKDYTGTDFDYRQDYTEKDLLKKLESFPSDFTPG
ncbi:MAG: beta-lactamase family protein, partial [Candidatus Aminicenantes bacterium]|nr:beta-lactamase family protein [Candidatus Aminicenantes bacterium]